MNTEYEKLLERFKNKEITFKQFSEEAKKIPLENSRA